MKKKHIEIPDWVLGVSQAEFTDHILSLLIIEQSHGAYDIEVHLWANAIEQEKRSRENPLLVRLQAAARK